MSNLYDLIIFLLLPNKEVRELHWSSISNFVLIAININ